MNVLFIPIILYIYIYTHTHVNLVYNKQKKKKKKKQQQKHILLHIFYLGVNTVRFLDPCKLDCLT